MKKYLNRLNYIPNICFYFKIYSDTKTWFYQFKHMIKLVKGTFYQRKKELSIFALVLRGLNIKFEKKIWYLHESTQNTQWNT
jgi:hypothetical protein